MLIYHDPDEWETVTTFTPCAFHEKNPGVPFAGCCCQGSVGQRMRDPEEAKALKAKRVRDEEDRILVAADAIRARRAAEALP